MYRALSVGIPETEGWAGLPFGRELLDELAQALKTLGYTCEVRLGPSSAGLGASVRDSLGESGDEGVLLVHVLGHGVQGRSDALYVLGSDGVRTGENDVASWLSELEDLPGRPAALLLLDLCHSGAMARLPWQLRHADGTARSWVLAACAQDEQAYDGRFTRALVTVLKALATDELGVDPSVRHVPLQTIGRAVLREVTRLRGKGYRQSVTGSVIDFLAEPDLPFFPNPHHRDGGVRVLLDPVMAPFLDEGVDPGALPQLDVGVDGRHFVDRASGGSLTGALVGFFTGRKEQVATLSEWIDGFGDGRLLVVTGGAGSGKSTLLGVMVCAAHHRLREVTRPLWKRAVRAPYQVPEGLFAAVHARQRTLGEIVSSLARQLGLDPVADPAGLLAALPGGGRSPVIVLDALDEAEDGPAVLRELLLPLVECGGVRLVVGVRKYEEYQPLRAAARVIDLDEVEAGVLEDDLHHYVSDLLRGTERYRRLGAVVGGFAGALATALTEGGMDRSWGEFLVARIYTRSFAEGTPVADPVEAEEIGRGVPRTVTEVFDQDLAARGQPWLRSVLAALAQAHGQGMPVSVLARLVGPTRDEAPTNPALEPRVHDALKTGRFYLRTSVDVDGVTLYRLFHQGLADHLKARSGITASVVLDRLLSPLGPPEERWRAAEPYVLRHAIQHAADAGRTEELSDDQEFLARAPVEALEPLFGRLAPRLAADLRAVAHAREPARRAVLDLAMLRTGRAVDGTGDGWRPLWIRPRSRLHEPAFQHAQSLEHARAKGVRALEIADVAGARMAVAADRLGVVRLWDLARGRLVREFTTHSGTVSALAVGTLDDNPVALVGGGADGSLQAWDLATGTQVGPPLRHRSAVTAVAMYDRDTVVSAAHEDSLRFWNLRTGEVAVGPKTAVSPGSPVAALSVSHHTSSAPTLVLLLKDGTLVAGQHYLPMGACAILVTKVGPQPVIIAGDRNGVVSMLDLSTLANRAAPLRCHDGPVRALNVLQVPAGPMVVTLGADEVLRFIHLDTWTPKPLMQVAAPDARTAVATVVERTPVMVTGSWRGSVDVWRPCSSLLSRAVDPRLVPAGPGWRLVEEEAVVSLVSGERTGDAPEGWAGGQIVLIGGRPWLAVPRLRRRRPGQPVPLWDPERDRRAEIGAPGGTPLPRGDELICQGQRARVIRTASGGVAVHSDQGQETRAELRPHAGDVTAVAATELGERDVVLTGGSDGWVHLLDVHEWRVVDSVYVGDPVQHVLASPDGHLVVMTASETIGFRRELT
uniref:Probable serine/threonine-protein kinase pkwA n=1 Tax=Nonomuraea gerenzanensis TaxID=93944 RepID=A0A1M4E444_9ACTN|nr:Probable serine/threonine-protein kinase pkwA [Nonomuraea gerenzanensis]